MMPRRSEIELKRSQSSESSTLLKKMLDWKESPEGEKEEEEEEEEEEEDVPLKKWLEAKTNIYETF